MKGENVNSLSRFESSASWDHLTYFTMSWMLLGSRLVLHSKLNPSSGNRNALVQYEILRLYGEP